MKLIALTALTRDCYSTLEYVHADYHEFYTLPKGKVHIGLSDIRRESPTFGKSVDFVWSCDEDFAVSITIGVAHAVHFIESSVLVLGLSDFWQAEYNVLGCRWDDPELGFGFNCEKPHLSERDQNSGGYAAMLVDYENLRRKIEPV